MDNSEERTETILIVEDIDWIRAGMKKEVERQGYAVIEAKNDAEAAAAHRVPIVLILTDEEMPTFDALLAQRRENGSLRNVPIAIVDLDAEEGSLYGDCHLLPDYSHIRTFLASQR